MNVIEVEVLSHAINNPVLKLPHRNYPGIVIQGDSLKILERLAHAIWQACEAGDVEEARDLATELHDSLAGRVAMYEAALAAHDLSLPYPTSDSSHQGP